MVILLVSHASPLALAPHHLHALAIAGRPDDPFSGLEGLLELLHFLLL